MAAEEVDFEPEVEEDEELAPAAATETAGASGAGGGAGAASGGKDKAKGRGAKAGWSSTDKYGGRGGTFESIEASAGTGNAQKSVEGWILFVTNVHDEAQEDDVVDAFADFGEVKNVNLNLDRRTGYVKGYALIEFEKREEAEAAIKGMNDKPILGQDVKVDWAIVKDTKARGGRRHRR